MSLRDEKWPFIVGFILSLLGWHIAQLTDEIRSGTTVLYTVQVNEPARLFTVSIENISKQKSVSGVTFLVQCRGGVDCIDSSSTATRIIDVPPTYSSGSPLIDDIEMRMRLSIAAGGRFGMQAKLRAGTPHPEFYLVLTPASESGETPTDIYVLNSASLRGWFVQNYVPIVATSFLVFLAAFAALMLWMASARRLAQALAGGGRAGLKPETEVGGAA